MCRHWMRLALGIGGAMFVGAGHAQAEIDYSLRGNAEASFGGEITDDSLGGLSFDLDADPATLLESDGGEVAGGLDGVFGAGDGHDEPGFGGSDGSLPGTTEDGYAAPTPTAALLGGAGLAGIGLSRRRR